MTHYNTRIANRRKRKPFLFTNYGQYGNKLQRIN